MSLGDDLRRRQAREEALAFESAWQRLMRAPAAEAAGLVAQLDERQARQALERLNAAPGDNPAVRRALEARIPFDPLPNV